MIRNLLAFYLDITFYHTFSIMYYSYLMNKIKRLWYLMHIIQYHTTLYHSYVILKRAIQNIRGVIKCL